jgi:hypothetical protein
VRQSVVPFAYDLFAMRTPGKRRCSATNSRGEHCRATVVNAAGFCAAHDPEGKFDARELGRAGAASDRTAS